MMLDSGTASPLHRQCAARRAESAPDRYVSTLCVAASIDSLDQVAEFALRLAEQAGLPTEAGYRLRLAADELATNIVMHGYRGAEGRMEVSGEIGGGRVQVRFEDDAPAFNPRDGMRAPDLRAPLSERGIGGLGVFLALTAVDSFEYERVRGRNVSTLVINVADNGQMR